MKNILIVKPSSFGDIVQANATLTALKDAYPDARISWLVFDVWQDVLSFFPGVDERIVWNKKGGIREYLRIMELLQERRFDLVVDLQGLLRSAILTACSGAKKIVGVPGMKELSWLLVKEPFPESRSLNAVHRSLETVRYLTDKKTEPRFEVTVPGSAVEEAAALLAKKGMQGDRLIGLVPFARGNAKEWPVERYEELIYRTAGTGYTVVLLGGKEDAGRISGENVVDLCGETSMLLLGGILSKCSVVAGSDTGPTHLAAALGVPVVMLFGGSDVRETAPVTKNAVVLKKDYACSPCRGRKTCRDTPCLRDISADEVFQAMQPWIK
jgi:lipopolysaccharide heptosyltransferase II